MSKRIFVIDDNGGKPRIFIDKILYYEPAKVKVFKELDGPDADGTKIVLVDGTTILTDFSPLKIDRLVNQASDQFWTGDEEPQDK